MNKTEYIAQHRIRLRAEHAEGPRYCTQCKCTRPRIGGRAIPLDGGMRERWVCGLHGEVHGPAA